MSSAFFSPYIPDFDLITYYAENNISFLSRISPWSKVFMLAAIVLLVTVNRSVVLLAGLYAVVLLLYLAARLPPRKLAAWSVIPALFVISLVGLIAWGEPGLPLFSCNLAGFTPVLTDNGAMLVISLILKAFIAVTFTLLFLMTTRYGHLAGMISRIFPAPLDQIFLMAYRFLSLTLAMTDSLFKSVYSRGGGLFSSLRMQGSMFAGIFALVFIRSLERGERVHKAMTARGFTGSYPVSGEVPLPGMAELTILVFAAVLLAEAVMSSPFRGW